MKKITFLGFPGNVVIVGKNRETATILPNIVIQRFHEILINLFQYPLDMTTWMKGYFHLFGFTIFALYKRTKKNCYLRTDFSDNIVLHTGKIGQDLKRNLDLLIGSPLLKAEQKFSVINQFILPKLVYCFQNNPPSEMSQTFLTKVATIIKKSPWRKFFNFQLIHLTPCFTSQRPRGLQSSVGVISLTS